MTTLSILLSYELPSSLTAYHPTNSQAMEQQRLSVAKAGIVTTLNTRTIVIATCNPRGKYDVSQDLSVNTSIGSPLLSRFDLILLLLDNSNKKVDT